MQDKKNFIEAALFAAARPMTAKEITEAVKLDKKDVKDCLKEMLKEYEHHGIEIVEIDGRYELKIKNKHLEEVMHLAPNQDFSRAVLQTLSSIAYKQPVRQSDIVELRGNRAYEHIKELLDRGFIRLEPSGHTNLIHVTHKFLEYFGLKSVKEIKIYFSESVGDINIPAMKSERKQKAEESKEAKDEADDGGSGEITPEEPESAPEKEDIQPSPEDNEPEPADEEPEDETEQPKGEEEEKKEEFKSAFADVIEKKKSKN